MNHPRGAMRTPAVAGLLTAAALLIGGMIGAPAAEASECSTRRVATLAPPGSAWMKILSKGAADLEAATKGCVKTKYYPGGVQGDERDVVRKMRLNQLDGAALTTVGLSMIDESIRVLELPMLFKNVEEMTYVRKKMWPHFVKKFLKKGFILGPPGDVGFIYFYSNVPVNDLNALKTSNVWMWTDDRLVRAMFKKLAINGVPMGVPDVLPALQTGKIDAFYGSPLAAVALQWYTKAKYSTSMPMSYAIGSSVISKAMYDSASAEHIKTQEDLTRSSSKRLRKIIRKDNKRALKAMTRAGIQIIETPPAMVAEFEKAAHEVWEELAGRLYSKAELTRVLKLRDAYRAKHP